MTTLPKRLPKIRKIILSILDTGIDLLYLNIPYETKSGEKYIIPDFLQDLNRVKIIRCEDYGPITKLLPVLDIECEPNTCIITFDDDMIVDNKVVKILSRKSKKYPQCCIGFSGACAGRFPFIYQWTNTNRKDTYVDWLEGVHSILYKRKFLDKKEILNFCKPIQHLLFKNDDHWISAYLASKKIPRISMGYNPESYFKETSIKHINPLSGRSIKLYWEHIRIIHHLMKADIYTKQNNWTHSIGFIFVIISSIVLFIIKRAYVTYFWVLLFLGSLVW
jgi:hypothetical protein